MAKSVNGEAIVSAVVAAEINQALGVAQVKQEGRPLPFDEGMHRARVAFRGFLECLAGSGEPHYQAPERCRGGWRYSRRWYLRRSSSYRAYRKTVQAAHQATYGTLAPTWLLESLR